jgi:uncharacterized membrane protein
MSPVDVWQNVVLIAALVSAGLVAGLLFGWAVSVMPGIGRTDDATFVRSFQAMDQAIVASPSFIVAFVGTPLLTIPATVMHLGADDRAALPWTIAGLGFVLATIAITRVVHLPLNAEIQAFGDPDGNPGTHDMRERFERRWVRWNVVRAATATAVVVCLGIAVAL